jgi:hypothetical protein
MFFLTRVKGVYTFDDADSKHKMVIDVPKKQALINFNGWHLSFSGGVISLSRNGDICTNVNHILLYEMLSIIFSSAYSYSDSAKWAEIELIDKAISLSERYPDLHFGRYINIDPGMFNGKFIQFCLDEDITFHMGNWRTFLKLERIKQQMPQDLQEICLEYQEIFSDESFLKKDLIKLARFLKHNSKKQINRSMLCKLLYLLQEMPELWKEVRTQDDFFKVYTRIYKIYCLKENNGYLEQIAKNESQIIEIEDMTTENYCVVVPRSLEDLITEGQQQNNCVGYYYCEDISENYSLIYFVRRKDNKGKSVYTCRYDTLVNKTVEYRGFNNSEIMDEEVLSFLDKIDYRLRNILKD